MMIWTCAQSEIGREHVFGNYLTDDGFGVYCPQAKVRQPGRPPRIVSLFPSYLFVRTELTRWLAIKRTIGCIRVLMHGDQPAMIREKIIRQIRRREGKDGMIDISPPSRIRRGTRVSILRGPFGGLEGLFECESPHERVEILLALFGQSTKVEVPAADIAVIG